MLVYVADVKLLYNHVVYDRSTLLSWRVHTFNDSQHMQCARDIKRSVAGFCDAPAWLGSSRTICTPHRSLADTKHGTLCCTRLIPHYGTLWYLYISEVTPSVGLLHRFNKHLQLKLFNQSHLFIPVSYTHLTLPTIYSV